MTVSDFNDLAASKGLEAVRRSIDEVVAESASADANVASVDKEKNGPTEEVDTGRAITGFNADGKRFIRHVAGRLPEVLDAMEASLSEATGINLFVHSGRLTRLHISDDLKLATVKRPKGTLVLHPVDSAHLSEIATGAARHEKFDARNGRDRLIDCPRRVAENYLSRGHYPLISGLSGFCEAPILVPDQGNLRLVDQSGYDKRSGLFLAFDRIEGYRKPPEKPTREDAERALDLLIESIGTFPFLTWEDRAAAIAAYGTSVQARILPARPIFCWTAPTPGTGKSLGVDGVSIVATGGQASVLSLGHDDTEAEKRLGGVLLAGDAVVNIDNVERGLGGDLLCQATSQPFLRLRPMGTSSMVSVPTNTFLAATGNNLAIRGDLKRRVCMVRLDARVERPERRHFSRNHLDYIAAHRGELLRAVLTIPLAYYAAGRPAVDVPPMGGFELWDALIRRPLLWLGLPDPLASSDGLRESDPELETMRQFMTEAAATYGKESFTAAEVFADASERVRDASGKSTGIAIRPALLDAIRAACRDKPGSVALGYWLRAHRDRIVDGMLIERSGEDGHSKASQWRVIRTAGDRDHCG